MTIAPSKKQNNAELLEAIVKEQTIETVLSDTREKPNLVNLLAFLRLQPWRKPRECVFKARNVCGSAFLSV